MYIILFLCKIQIMNILAYSCIIS